MVQDLRTTQKAKEANNLLSKTPSEEEILEKMKRVQDSAPGEDGVRISYIRAASDEVRKWVMQMVTFMFEHRAHRWDEELNMGQIDPIFKKGDRNASTKLPRYMPASHGHQNTGEGVS